jgi:hypothetical protein
VGTRLVTAPAWVGGCTPTTRRRSCGPRSPNLWLYPRDAVSPGMRDPCSSAARSRGPAVARPADIHNEHRSHRCLARQECDRVIAAASVSTVVGPGEFPSRQEELSFGALPGGCPPPGARDRERRRDCSIAWRPTPWRGRSAPTSPLSLKSSRGANCSRRACCSSGAGVSSGPVETPAYQRSSGASARRGLRCLLARRRRQPVVGCRSSRTWRRSRGPCEGPRDRHAESEDLGSFGARRGSNVHVAS